VIDAGDGIAHVEGLQAVFRTRNASNSRADVLGVALNLDEHSIGRGHPRWTPPHPPPPSFPPWKIEEWPASQAHRRGFGPVGDAYLCDGWSTPWQAIDGLGDVERDAARLERMHTVVVRGQSVKEPLPTGNQGHRKR